MLPSAAAAGSAVDASDLQTLSDALELALVELTLTRSTQGWGCTWWAAAQPPRPGASQQRLRRAERFAVHALALPRRATAHAVIGASLIQRFGIEPCVWSSAAPLAVSVERAAHFDCFACSESPAGPAAICRAFPRPPRLTLMSPQKKRSNACYQAQVSG